MTDFAIKQDDTSPSIEATLTNSSGNAIDLTGSDVDFHMSQRRSSGTKVDSSATIVDTSGGVVKYDWTSGDTDTEGVFYGEFEVTYSDSTIETFPNDDYIDILVTEEIA